ncbi:GlsB/YeaQ/YmgE family stress response membrane protein [Mycobacterium tilburgii]|uniref:GlsB/YeaQ/YmgE family stress response membrane protein n=1 Tax=Mycobacterium tilburgii TaxID=44467 RepID=UPI0016435B2A
MGWAATAVLGIVGSYVGGTLGGIVFPPHQFDAHPPIQRSSSVGWWRGDPVADLPYKFATSRTKTL